MSNKQMEFNILGCSIRIKSDENNDRKAQEAMNLVNEEIHKLKNARPGLRDTDIAVLSALNLASKLLSTEGDFKDDIFALKLGVEDALKFVEKVSPGTMQINP